MPFWTDERVFYRTLKRVPMIGTALRKSRALALLRECRRLFADEAPAESLVVDAPKAWESYATRKPSDDSLYRAMIEVFRSDSATLEPHLRGFLPYLLEAARACPGLPLVDIGCGRGDLLRVIHEAGLTGLGVETSPEAIAGLTAAGLQAVQADACSFLEAAADESLAAVVSIAMLEHVEAKYAMAFVQLAARKVAPGGVLIVETSNPECFGEQASFWIDPSHVRFYHPAFLALYAAHVGFGDVKVVYSLPAPFPIRLSGAESSRYLAYAVVGTKRDLGRKAE
jgi:2-polyprenyl-3-methyl-5-hydroxy-6-metoxy-1,4-benzoquinol methylase